MIPSRYLLVDVSGILGMKSRWNFETRKQWIWHHVLGIRQVLIDLHESLYARQLFSVDARHGVLRVFHCEGLLKEMIDEVITPGFDRFLLRK